MPGDEFEETYGSSVNARMAAHAGEGPPPEVDDLERAARAGDPPVPGAQWDELHRRWEIWDDDAQAWVVVGDSAGDGVAPVDENLLTPTLARELQHADELDATAEVVPDIDREAAQGEPPPGAQWNEVAGRWERWDDASGAWVEATDDEVPPAG